MRPVLDRLQRQAQPELRAFRVVDREAKPLLQQRLHLVLGELRVPRGAAVERDGVAGHGVSPA